MNIEEVIGQVSDFLFLKGISLMFVKVKEFVLENAMNC